MATNNKVFLAKIATTTKCSAVFLAKIASLYK